jgi:DNA-binding transcriptional ArsR family regulator
MAKKNFIMLELDDDKTKKVANVVSNESCRKILDYLAEHEGTESGISKELDIPISTVHYNLSQLMETGLVIADEYHYSEKGKEVNHYKIANKYIIIAPKKVNGIAQKLRGILPAALITAGVAGIIQLFSSFSKSAGSATLLSQEAAPMMAKSIAVETVNDAMLAVTAQDRAADAMGAGAPLANETVTLTANAITQNSPLWHNLALWFLIGAMFALLVYAIISYFKKE